MSPPGVVFDSVAFLQVVGSRNGPAAACWECVRSGQLVHFTSAAILDEYRDVVNRPKVRKRLRISNSRLDEILNSVEMLSTQLNNIPHRFNFARDPADEPLLDLAIEANARFLVTWDNDLLDLMKPESAEGQVLRAQAPHLRIVTPPELLGLLQATSDSE